MSRIHPLLAKKATHALLLKWWQDITARDRTTSGHFGDTPGTITINFLSSFWLYKMADFDVIFEVLNEFVPNM